jgi:hypothetical protein
MHGPSFIISLNREQNATQMSIAAISMIKTVMMTQQSFLLIRGIRDESSAAGFCTRAAIAKPKIKGMKIGRMYLTPKYIAAAYADTFISLKKLEDKFKYHTFRTNYSYKLPCK